MSNGYGSGKDTRQTALRDLYVKLGGNIADVAEENDINRLIRDLGNVAGGGGGGVTIVHDVNATLDMTAGEIFSAAQTGVVIVMKMDGNEVYDSSPVQVSHSEGQYFVINVAQNVYSASDADTYPICDDK